MADAEEILLEAELRMDGAIAAVRREFAGVRTGRAHPNLIETMPVEHYGATTPLNQLGTVNAPEARMLTAQIWDAGAVQAVVKAIQASDLGLNPSVDGQLIRLPIPALTEERRRELVKVVHQKMEDAKVAVRNVRRHSHDELRKAQKNHELSEDELRNSEDSLQELTDKHVDLVEGAGKAKEEELLDV